MMGVKGGETYFYKVQPYADCKGTLVKGRMSKALSASAIYDQPVAAKSSLINGKASNELIFKVTMETFSYDTVFAVSTDLTVEKEQRQVTLQQSWKNGDAEELRETFPAHQRPQQRRHHLYRGRLCYRKRRRNDLYQSFLQRSCFCRNRRDQSHYHPLPVRWKRRYAR